MIIWHAPWILLFVCSAWPFAYGQHACTLDAPDAALYTFDATPEPRAAVTVAALGAVGCDPAVAVATGEVGATCAGGTVGAGSYDRTTMVVSGSFVHRGEEVVWSTDEMMWGGVLAHTGKLYFVPHKAEKVLIVDPTTDSYDRTAMMGLAGKSK